MATGKEWKNKIAKLSDADVLGLMQTEILSRKLMPVDKVFEIEKEVA